MIMSPCGVLPILSRDITPDTRPRTPPTARPSDGAPRTLLEPVRLLLPAALTRAVAECDGGAVGRVALELVAVQLRPITRA